MSPFLETHVEVFKGASQILCWIRSEVEKKESDEAEKKEQGGGKKQTVSFG